MDKIILEIIKSRKFEYFDHILKEVKDTDCHDFSSERNLQKQRSRPKKAFLKEKYQIVAGISKVKQLTKAVEN